MMRALREKVVVEREGLIVIRSSELPPPGTATEVVVLFDDATGEEPAVPLTSLIGSTRGTFASPEEADAYLNGERDSWDS